VLDFGEPIGAICRDWNEHGPKPVGAKQWQNTSLVLTLISARLAGFREWQGQKYPTTQWPAIFDLDTHERLVRLFSDPARRRGAVRRHVYLLSGMAVCPRCGRRMYYRDWKGWRADSYVCIGGFAAIRSVGFEPAGQVFGAAVYSLSATARVGCPGTAGRHLPRDRLRPRGHGERGGAGLHRSAAPGAAGCALAPGAGGTRAGR